MNTPDEVITLVEADRQSGVIQVRTKRGMVAVLEALGKGGTFAEAARTAKVEKKTATNWRKLYEAFDLEVGELMATNAGLRKKERVESKWANKVEAGLVLNFEAEIPDPGGLVSFRWDYFGRPTPIHQRGAVKALEDLTNLYVFIFGPTGMGKDTLTGDYAAWRVCPDRSGLRCAWIMKTGPKAARRLQRLGRYMTDPVSIREAPERTPGGQRPSKSLIEDFGPFRWESGMAWEDGTEAHRPEWRKDQFYFVRSIAPEQDPNWQAVGVEQALYGDRIDEAVCSDMFDLDNQKSPTERANQLRTFNGTLHSRLDESGRLVIAGTWLPIEHNYETILETYTADARVVKTEVDGPSVYTKYSNGVAVVIIKAINPDPVTGEEVSYWPEKFPLDDFLESPDEDDQVDADELTDARLEELSDAGWTRKRGLRSIRSKDPIMFRAMYQQERDTTVAHADFDDETLDMAMDPSRSFGQVLPTEITLLGVDPARRYGAAWVLLAVDRSERAITIADFAWFTALGVTGVKNELIIKPLARFSPSWLCYESNREGAVFAQRDVWKIIDESHVSLFTHDTGRERGSIELGPGALAAWMRSFQLRIPSATAEDRQRAEQLRTQFKAFDSNPERSRPGRAGHDPDDLVFATWIPWLKAAGMVDPDSRGTGIITGVPSAIRRRFDRRGKDLDARRATKGGRSERDVVHQGDNDPLDMLRMLADE